MQRDCCRGYSNQQKVVMNRGVDKAVAVSCPLDIPRLAASQSPRFGD
jgi:hypothetical protein